MTAPLPLHVETRGRTDAGAAAFVLLHGYGASSFSWRAWTPALERRGRVLLVDLKGFGRAPQPEDGRYAPTDQAELVHRLVVREELGDVTLIGHSLGGGVALLAALRLLDEGAGRLRRLVVVAGAAYAQRMPPFVTLAHHPRLSRLLLRAVGARMVALTVLRTCVYDAASVTHEQVEGYAAPLRRQRTAGVLIDTALQLVPPGLDALTARYGEIDVPALVLWGRHDRVVPLAHARRLAMALPRAQLVVLDRCGHLPAEERPGASLAALEDFLDASGPG
jgi:pimeloyl-ACP methyl ester carboxylesterase